MNKKNGNVALGLGLYFTGASVAAVLIGLLAKYLFVLARTGWNLL